MTKTKKITIGVVIVAILLIGIGYATLSGITLNVKGSASATTNNDNFSVEFTDTEVSNSSKVTASVSTTNPLTASIEVSGLTAKGEKVTATYTIENTSENAQDLIANLSVNAPEYTNDTYFKVTADIVGETSIGYKETTKVTITVELLKTPVNESADDLKSSIEVTIDAEPTK